MTDPIIGVHVDHDQCSGTAHCQHLVPEIFTVVNRKSWVRADVDWSTVDIARLERVVESCPWFAISIESPPPEGS